VLRRRPTSVGPLRQRGDARPEVVDSRVETAQFAARAEIQADDKADDEGDDNAENNDCSY